MAAQFATESLHNPLWDFCIALYAKPHVKEVLLALQDDADMDVLIILADAWLRASNRHWVSTADLSRYLTWRTDMVVPLRTLRKTLERHQEPLRSQLLRAELSAEQHAVAFLYDAFIHGTTVPVADILNESFAFFLDQNRSQKKEAARPLFQTFIDLSQS